MDRQCEHDADYGLWVYRFRRGSRGPLWRVAPSRPLYVGAGQLPDCSRGPVQSASHGSEPLSLIHI
eukprot:4575101-Pyramimonas_sp.AAC.1